jgi:glycosyltransferase involved in cell wall biosynthesis
VAERRLRRPLRLAFVASASIHSVRWMSYFAAAGHTVRWFATSVPDGNVAGLPYEVLPAAHGGSRSVAIAVSVRQLRRRLQAFQPDVVHAHYAGVPGVLGWLAGVRPFVLSAWGSDVLVSSRRAVSGWPIRQALRAADLVTCDAQHMLGALARAGVDRSRLIRINFGTDLERFRPMPREARLDQRLHLDAGPRVISIRALLPVYDVATLVRSVPQVLASVPGTTFVIAGTGAEEARLRQLAADLGVSDRIRFCGAIPNAELPEYFAAADVYVSTALSDAGLASSTQEAMACGLPVVVTRTGENHLWIEPGVTGELIDAGDAATLASHLAILLREPARRAALAAGGRALIAERTNYHVEMAKMETHYVALSIGSAQPDAEPAVA